MRKIIKMFSIMLAGLASASATASTLNDMVSVRASGVAVTDGGRVWTSLVARPSAGSCVAVISWSDNADSLMQNSQIVSYGDADVLESVLWGTPEGGLVLFVSTSDGFVRTKFCDAPDAASPEWRDGADVGRGPWKCCSMPAVIDGTWILPLAIQRGVCTVVSDDMGRTWTMNQKFLRVPDVVSGNNNPVLVADKDRLSIYIRSNGTAQCYRADSGDMGKTWTTPYGFIPNPDRDINILRLADGRLLMVKNARLDHTQYKASLGLIAYLSDDGGQTWYGSLSLNADRKGTGPRTTVGKDGKIYVLFTYDEDVLPEIRLCVTSAQEIAGTQMWNEQPAADVRTIAVAGMAEEIAGCVNELRTDWASETLRVATWNIQYPKKTPAWRTERLDAVVKLIRQYEFDVFGVQEPFLPQINDMMEHLGDTYAWIGTSITGDNTWTRAHFDPVFYRKDRLELLEWDTVWYAEKPAVNGYGAYSPRLMTWARFRDMKTGKVFCIFNSHYDHIGVEAREVSSEILVKTVREIAAGCPALMTGDFNSDEDSVPYRIVMESGFINDSMLAVEDPVNAEYFSMSRYRPIDTVKKSGRHIDHVFYTTNSVKVQFWKLILDSYDGRFGSDHLPIVVDVLIAD